MQHETVVTISKNFEIVQFKIGLFNVCRTQENITAVF